MSIGLMLLAKFNQPRKEPVSLLNEMAGWIKSGKVKWKETVEHGIENAPAAFLKLFNGENLGKMLVKLN